MDVSMNWLQEGHRVTLYLNVVPSLRMFYDDSLFNILERICSFLISLPISILHLEKGDVHREHVFVCNNFHEACNWQLGHIQ